MRHKLKINKKKLWGRVELKYMRSEKKPIKNKKKLKKYLQLMNCHTHGKYWRTSSANNTSTSLFHFKSTILFFWFLKFCF